MTTENTTESNLFTDALMNEIIQAQQNLDRIKSEKRQAALDYIQKLVKVFDFSDADVFDNNVNSRSNLSKLCKEALLSNPAMSRKEFMNWAKSNNISTHTASAQYWKVTKEIAANKKIESAAVADPKENDSSQ